MNTAVTTDDMEESVAGKPGAILAEERKAKGYSIDYVAGKLHLRGRVIELLEADDYENMPEPVFIKGYLRAYAILLELDYFPLLHAFNCVCKSEKKTEKAPLWQSRKESHKAEHAVKWLTALFAIGVTIAVAFWWYKNKDNEKAFSVSHSAVNHAENKSDSEIRLTDLSKMRSLLSSQSQNGSMELARE